MSKIIRLISRRKLLLYGVHPFPLEDREFYHVTHHSYVDHDNVMITVRLPNSNVELIISSKEFDGLPQTRKLKL